MSILLLMWETLKREEIILNDESVLNTDKLELLEETDAILPGTQNNY